MGAVLDGVAPHMNGTDEKYTFVKSDRPEQSKAEIVNSIKQSGAEVLVNYLPVGSQEAVEFYAECALDAGVAFVNCIPVFIASQPLWADKFKRHNIPIIGDDIKSQFGATISHRALVDLCKKRGGQSRTHLSVKYGGGTPISAICSIALV